MANPNFTSYSVGIRGTGSGVEPGIRAVVTLFNDMTVVGSVMCWDAGTAVPSDSSATPLKMNVPVAMLPVILDVLRHEGPLQIMFNKALGKVLLFTATGEPVGEDET
jgi:hypothetical protein